MKTLIVFLLIFSIIVIFHELGHFIFARRAGIMVREFAIGMGPKLYSRQAQDGTTYTLRMLPLGGYVRMAGMDEELELQPGMEVGLVLNDQDQVSEINLSDQAAHEELPLRLEAVDLGPSFTLSGYLPNQDQVSTYPLASNAMIREADGTKVQVAPLDQTYEAASPWGKLMTNIAGPMNNFILAFVAFLILGFAMPGVPVQEAVIGELVPEGPAQVAGLETGDRILAINDESIDSWSDLVYSIQAHPNEEQTFKVDRQGQEQEVIITIGQAEDPATGDAYGQIGIYAGMATAWTDRVLYAFEETWHVATAVITGLITLIRGLDLDQLGGPVAIAQLTHEVAANGLLPMISFLAFLSANLGVVNLLPIPALDGGKIVMNVIELVRGRPISREKEGWITIISMIILFLLMILVTWNDIMRLFR